MVQVEDIVTTLQSDLELYREVLELVEGETRELSHGTGDMSRFEAARRELLPRLAGAVERMAALRQAWQACDPARRSRHPEVGAFIRENQDLLMKAMVLDRENEQELLRRGMVPVRDLPSVNRQRPHFVTDLYRRQGGRSV